MPSALRRSGLTVLSRHSRHVHFSNVSQIVNGKIKITKKVGLTITTYGNDKLPTGYLF